MSPLVGVGGARTAGRRLRRRGRKAAVFVASLLVASAGALSTATASGAATGKTSTGTQSTGTQYYLALGDSLAAGVGSPDGKGYVADIYAKEHKVLSGLVLENLSCSGATTGSMLDGGGCSYTTGSQEGDAEAFLKAHPGQVAFITVDIGANDVDGCTDGTSVDMACVTAGLNAITKNLPLILSGLASAGGSTPILGMSYYDPFLAEWLLGSSGQSLAHESVALLDELNGILAGDFGAGHTADVADAFASSNFALHGMYESMKVPVNVGRICSWTLMCSEENIHADDIGHAHIAKAFEKVIKPSLAAGRRARA
jgi:lysophospholipase L1-like esterase